MKISSTNITDNHNQEFDYCAHNFRVSCSDCRLGTICLPIAVSSDEIDQLDNIIQRARPLQKGEHLYREGDEFQSIFAVRSGSVKGYSITGDGKEQVTGFYMPGEVLGMDGISKNHYASSAKAMETAAICEIPFDSLGNLSTKIPSLQRHFFQLMSTEIANDQKLITLLSKNSAEERIAALLLSISSRNARRKLSPTSFRLPMSRTDIGNYLGLTVETVSRVFSRFQKNGAIEVDSKELNISDIDLLRDIVNIKNSAS